MFSFNQTLTPASHLSQEQAVSATACRKALLSNQQR